MYAKKKQKCAKPFRVWFVEYSLFRNFGIYVQLMFVLTLIDTQAYLYGHNHTVIARLNKIFN